MATTTLDYWGHDPNNSVKRSALDDVRSAEEIELLLESSMSEIEEKTNQASHIVTIRFKETMQDLEINTAAGVKALSLGYSMTIHKSQGSQWNKVFCVFHQSHGTMMQRELLYTAVTRAAKELYIICEQDTFTKAIINQRIKGETLEEKFDHFKGKLLSNTNYGDIP
jgi:superfamily I DNA/RNA helicase